jgi:hypothetical protein
LLKIDASQLPWKKKHQKFGYFCVKKNTQSNNTTQSVKKTPKVLKKTSKVKSSPIFTTAKNLEILLFACMYH